MKSFLQQLTDVILEKYGEDLSGLCVVFPTRRAGLFFRNELSTRISKPVWSPATFSIQDFLALLCPYQIPDPLTLQFELFKVYKKYFPQESFDRFYPWGDLLLRDFEDIDRHLADAGKVFSTIHDMREIDRDFDLADDQLEQLKMFWENFFQKDISRLKSEFMNTWEHLGRIYSDFQNSLLTRNLAYEGMAYRKIAENWSANNFKALSGYDRIIFAGFYALSKAEEQIINRILENGKADIFWDADVYYSNDPRQEAGVFLRNNLLAGKNFNWNENHFASGKKRINVTGIPLQVGQAKYSGQLLEDWMKEPGFKSENTVVVLPDENLLFPVLYALPESLKDINVTMGYPLHYTPLYQLFESLVSLQKNAQKSKSGLLSFYYRDVINILQHPYIRQIEPDAIKSWLTQYSKKRIVRIGLDELLKSTDPVFFTLLFSSPVNLKELFSWCKQILRRILESMKEQQFRFHRLESEFVYHFFTQLNRLEEVISEQEEEPGLITFWNLFREIIYASKIPFTGEPLKGLQVMGFLETRVLDFENVIILSVNEDVLPASGNKPSFIPYNLRKAFSLPTYEDQHAVSAYHFYRLLQRAGRIQLLYNTETRSIDSGEKSRFLLQLKNELIPAFQEQIVYHEQVLSTSFRPESSIPIVVKKTPDVMEKLNRYLVAADSEQNSKKLSASALISYIQCSLKFYFRYVAELKEQEETEETMEASTFGKVLHKTMELLYQDQEEVSAFSIKNRLPKVDECLDQAMLEEFSGTMKIEGKNLLLRHVISELVRKILATDQTDAPFQIRLLEKELTKVFMLDQNRNVRIHGVIDRVDEINRVIRVIDYKTGKVEKKKIVDLFEYFSEPKVKEQFQAMLYAGLVRTVMPGKPIRSGLITLRDNADGVWYLNNGEPFSDDQFNEFDAHLRSLLHELLNPEIPFDQTADQDRCKHCPYTDLCNR